MKPLLGRAAEPIVPVDFILDLCSAKAAFITGSSNAPEPTRHQDTFNILWVDGHVSNMSTLTFKAGKPSFESRANGSPCCIYAGKK